MLCFRCGSPVSDTARACDNCGQDLSSPGGSNPEIENTGKFSDLQRKLRQTGRDWSRAATYQVGDVVRERYEIKDVVGSGALGVVYKAFDQEVEVDLALKVIATEFLPTEETRANFCGTYKRVRDLIHENAVRFFDVDRDGDRCFYVMQFLEGLTLRKVIKLRRDKAQRFAVGEVEPIYAQLCRALGDSRRLTVHGGLKPENIIILPDLLKVTDFFLAEALPRSAFLSAQRAGVALRYLAPEVREQEPFDARADVYSIAVILVELLTGRDYEAGEDALAGMDPDLPEVFSRVLAKALREDPTGRYPHAGELGADLSAALTGGKVRLTKPYAPPKRVARGGAAAEEPPEATVRRAPPGDARGGRSAAADLASGTDPSAPAPAKDPSQVTHQLEVDDIEFGSGSARVSPGDITDGEDEILVRPPKDERTERTAADNLGARREAPSSELLAAARSSEPMDRTQQIEADMIVPAEEEHEEEVLITGRLPLAGPELADPDPVGPKIDWAKPRAGLAKPKPEKAKPKPEKAKPRPELAKPKPELQLVPTPAAPAPAPAAEEPWPLRQSVDASGEFVLPTPDDHKPSVAVEGDSWATTPKISSAALAEREAREVRAREALQAFDFEAALERAVESAASQPVLDDADGIEDATPLPRPTSLIDEPRAVAPAPRRRKSTPLTVAPEVLNQDAVPKPLDVTQSVPRPSTAPKKTRVLPYVVVGFVAVLLVATGGVVYYIIKSREDAAREELERKRTLAMQPDPPAAGTGGKWTKPGGPAAETLKPDAARPEPAAKIEPVAKTEPTPWIEPKKVEPKKVEPKKVEPKKVEATKRKPEPREPRRKTELVAKREPRRKTELVAKAEPRVKAEPRAKPKAEAKGEAGEKKCPAGLKFIPGRGDDGVCIDRFEHPGRGRMPTHGVSVEAARSACKARGLRLCLAKEWLRACGSLFPYGKAYDAAQCNTEGTSPVAAGSKSSCKSRYGIYDLSGNVSEWVEEGVAMGGDAKSAQGHASCPARSGGGALTGFRCCSDPEWD
jgi:eukaryotic-like serine/threonine-protein kinase